MPNQKRKPKAKKDKDDDNETVIKPIGRLLKNEEQTKYDGDDYDRPGWKPGETKKAKDCNKIYDFRMCHMRHTRYRTEDGESEVRQVATCGWCHCAWTYPNVSRITKHFSQAGETGYKDCPAKIPAQALKEYKAFAARQKKKLGSSPQRQDGAPGGAQDKETEPLGVLDADASAKHPEKPSDDDPTKRLDAAIAKFFIVDGLPPEKAQTPRFGNILTLARNTDDSYRVPRPRDILGVHLSSVYKNHIDGIHELWEGRGRITGITLCVDATQSRTRSLSLVTAYCADHKPQVIDVIATGKNKSSNGEVDPFYLALRIQEHLKTLDRVSLVTIDGLSDVKAAKDHLESLQNGPFVVPGISMPLRSMFNSFAQTEECQFLSVLCLDLHDALVGEKAHPKVRKFFYSRAILLLEEDSKRKSVTLLKPSERNGEGADLFFAMHRIVWLRPAIRDTLSGHEFRSLSDAEKVISDGALTCLQLESFYEALTVIVTVLHPALLLMEQVLNGTPMMDTLYYHCRRASLSIASGKARLDGLSFFGEPAARSAGYGFHSDGEVISSTANRSETSGETVTGKKDQCSSSAQPDETKRPAVKEGSEDNEARAAPLDDSQSESIPGTTPQQLPGSDSQMMKSKTNDKPVRFGDVLSRGWERCSQLLKSDFALAARALCPLEDVFDDYTDNAEEDDRVALLRVAKKVLEKPNQDWSSKQQGLIEKEMLKFRTKDPDDYKWSMIQDDTSYWHMLYTNPYQRELGPLACLISGKPCGIGKGYGTWSHTKNFPAQQLDMQEGRNKQHALYASELFQMESTKPESDKYGTTWKAKEDARVFSPILDKAPVRKPIVVRFLFDFFTREEQHVMKSSLAEHDLLDALESDLESKLTGTELILNDNGSDNKQQVVLGGVKWVEGDKTFYVTATKSADGTKSSSRPIKDIHQCLREETVENRDLFERQGIRIVHKENFERAEELVRKHSLGSFPYAATKKNRRRSSSPASSVSCGSTGRASSNSGDTRSARRGSDGSAKPSSRKKGSGNSVGSFDNSHVPDSVTVARSSKKRRKRMEYSSDDDSEAAQQRSNHNTPGNGAKKRKTGNRQEKRTKKK